ncbi:MAG: GNAT family N-acetyltransferase [Nocardioidaceae bacterium]
MGRRFDALTADNVGQLPPPCRSCVLWELGNRSPDAASKDGWISAVLLNWGNCGQIAYVDGRVAGFAFYAPPEYVEGLGFLSTAAISSDAVLLMTMRLLPGQAGSGLGRVLIQTVVKDLMRRRVKAIEAFGDMHGNENQCLIPARFLTAVGFKTVQPHPRYPRMRLELRNVLTWRDDVELAVERWLGAIRPHSVRPETGRGPVGVSPRAEPRHE